MLSEMIVSASIRRVALGLALCLCALGVSLVGGAGSALADGSWLFGEIGSEAGQVGGTAGGSHARALPRSMAIDEQGGDVYVSDAGNDRIDLFNRSGEFVLAWGGGVADGAPELQTCTITCREATPKESVNKQAALGEFCLPLGIAVDNEVTSASRGDVYVDDTFCNGRVQKFGPDGEFLLMFGGQVNKSGTDVCVAGEECQQGTQGTGDGEFSGSPYFSSDVAVGPNGDVYVGDQARVEIFQPDGVWKNNISLSGLTTEGKVSSLAVNQAGDVFVSVSGVPSVHEFTSSGVEVAVKIDEGSETVRGLAIAETGNLLIEDSQGNFLNHTFGRPAILEYTPSGEERESLDASPLVISGPAMAVDQSHGELLIYGGDSIIGDDEVNEELEHIGVFQFQWPPAPGPVVEPQSSLTVAAEPKGNATFAASLNPEGGETKYHIEYVTQAKFEAGGYAEATSTSPLTLAAAFTDEEESIKVSGLTPSAAYHWRVVASNANGTITGPDKTFQETPPARIEATWVTEVTATSADLHAQIDPLGAPTTYRLEYGTSTEYGHVATGSVGEGTASVAIVHAAQELQPEQIYHYRLVTTNEVGTVESVDHTFTTQSAVGGAAQLPDGRGWELVSPPNKDGALIESDELVQAASDGSGIYYAASQPIGEGIVSHVGDNINVATSASILSRRTGPGSWTTRDISPKQTIPPEGTSGGEMVGSVEAFYQFSPDLSVGMFEPRGPLAPQAEGITEKTLYLRDNRHETYLPLVNPGNVPPGTHFGPFTGENKESEQMSFIAATPDLSHVLFGSGLALTSDAVSGQGQAGAHPGVLAQNIYEWHEGQLQLVNVPGPGAHFGESQEGFAGGDEVEGGPNPSALSQDGRWVVFHYGFDSGASYYVRDTVEKKTYQFGKDGDVRFEAMSKDGSKIFYLEGQGFESEHDVDGIEQKGELYVFEPTAGKTVDLTADHLAGEKEAGVENALAGISEDGSTVYFVATGVLADGATQGENNLYVAHEERGSWTTSFIDTLSSGDEKDWRPEDGFRELGSVVTRVSPNGRYLSFMSDNSLTGYDNLDAVSGEPDEEAYIYDLDKKSVACVSCDPSGARPRGIFDQLTSQHLIDFREIWSGESDHRHGPAHGHWLAGVLAPAWHESHNVAFYQPRSLLNSGRLFFESTDPLVPQDTNGLADVYEFEPAGVGGCTAASSLFDAHIGGCVGLISSGQSSHESEFLDASETGDDAFFITASRLAPEDYDNSNDVYDAHVCSAAAPCATAPVSSPPCDSGDSCKAAPSPQPAIFGPAPSATFSGVGNVSAEVKNSVVKHKAKPKKKKRKKVKPRSRRVKKGRKSGVGHVGINGRGK